MVNQYKLDVTQQLKEQLNKVITQAIHDIQSPLSSLLMLANKSSSLNPYDLKKRINGILKSVLQPVQKITNDAITDEVIIVPKLIEQIIAEKKCEYTNFPIIFKSNLSECNSDLSILGNIDDFSRMLSNLINNAVEAVGNKSGIITINCNCADGKTVKITIEDNGQGMPDDVKNKILNNERVTNKTSGQGLGVTHTRETLAKYNGKLDIESNPGQGTKIILTFPCANKLLLNNNGTQPVEDDGIASKLKQVDIVIVEDDINHGNVMANFMFKDKKSDIFNTAKDFLANFNKYPLDTIILIDYQFPEENVNGVDVYKELYAKGYTNCYLYSGMDFRIGELPSYIKTILKTDLDALERLIK